MQSEMSGFVTMLHVQVDGNGIRRPSRLVAEKSDNIAENLQTRTKILP